MFERDRLEHESAQNELGKHELAKDELAKDKLAKNPSLQQNPAQIDSKLIDTTPVDSNANDNIVRHIEIKAYVDDYQALCTKVAQLASAGGPVDRVQNDTFFHCRSGRLKLRSSGQYHDLIYYRRQNEYGPSESVYQSARTINPLALRTSLSSAFGELGRVKKFRRTYRLGHSIIHLDRVAGLGEFIEIKVELGATSLTAANEFDVGPANINGFYASDLSASKGARLIEDLMSALDIDLFQLVDGAYVDLLNEQKGIGVHTG